jgi:hypothetical protein
MLFLALARWLGLFVASLLRPFQQLRQRRNIHRDPTRFAGILVLEGFIAEPVVVFRQLNSQAK